MNSRPISISDSSDVVVLKISDSSDGTIEAKLRSPGSSTIRRPYTWTSEKFKKNLLGLKTPSGIHRVVDWMGSNMFDNTLENKDVAVVDNESDDATFLRYDYKMNESGSPVKLDLDLSRSIFNKSVPLCTSKIALKNSKPNSGTDVSRNDDRDNIECFSNYACPKSVENFEYFYNSPYQSQNGDLHFSQSTSESRKKELYNYLKLMNHADKKEVRLSKFRRSTRVKNLEQKELAKRMQNENSTNDSDSRNEESSDQSSKTLKDKWSNFSECITLQSFNDLKMTVDASKYPTLQEEENFKNIFNFIMPPSTVLTEFNDFQYWVEPLIEERNMLDKNRKLNGKIEAIHVGHGNLNSMLKDTEENSKCELVNYKNKHVKKLKTKHRDKLKNSNTKTNKIKRNKNSPHEIDKKDSLILKTRNSIRNSCPPLHSEDVLISKKNIIYNRTSELILDKNIDTSTEKHVQKKIKIEGNGDIEENHVNIRINYNMNEIEGNKKIIENNLVELSNHEYIVKPSMLDVVPNFYGFTDDDINESQELQHQYVEYLHNLCSVPITSLYENKTVTNNNICTSPDKINVVQDLCEIKDVPHQEMEELQSESDTASNSLSTVDSEGSSDSYSISVPEKENSNELTFQKCDIISPSDITPRINKTLPFNQDVEVQTLHNLLRKTVKTNSGMRAMNSVQDWDSDNSINDKQKCDTSKGTSHSISFDKENGETESVIYVDFHLILVQEFAVSLWNQTALGNVLGAQNLWIFNGCSKKLILNKECIRKKSSEMVMSTEACVVYVELWTKEHKSDIRQGPVADVFATVYFWIQKMNKMDRKVLQLENINGFADDVQYVVLKPSLNIVVSWHSIVEGNRMTQIRVYTLAADFQSVVNVRAMAKVEHYVSSLHNIEDCEDLMMGCGEHKITLWNIEHGYIVASIELSDLKLSLSTLWVKCDRGILFTVQQCVDRELRLIAINGRSHSWKRLKSYMPPKGFERIQNLYIENGILLSFYEEGILCWKAQTGEQIVEEIHNETDVEYFPSGKYLIMLTEKNVYIRHALTHLLTVDD